MSTKLFCNTTRENVHICSVLRIQFNRGQKLWATAYKTSGNAYSLTSISTNAHCFSLVTTGFYRAFKSMGMYRTCNHQRIINEIYNCTYKYDVNMIQTTTVVDQAFNLSSGNLSTEITEPCLLPFLP